MSIEQHVTIEYTGKLPSVNHMYGYNKFGGMYLKAEGKRIKDEIIFKNGATIPQDQEVGYTLVVYGNWYNKSKTRKTRIKKRDSNNLLKLILDACCEAVGIDDSQIFEEHVYKKQSETEGFRIELFTISE